MLALVAFLAPTFLWMEIVVVGRIFVSELVLIGLLPLLLVRGHALAGPLPRTFLILAALWLAAQMLTDLIRETEFRDYARGWAKIAFTILNFCAIYLLVHGNRRRLVLFAFGIVAGGYLTYLLNPSDLAQDHPWKFGLGFSTTLLVILVSQWRPILRVPFLPALPIFLIGAYSATVGSRSLAGVTLLTAFFVLAQQVVGERRTRPVRGSPARVLPFLVVAVVLAGAVLELHSAAVLHGYVGERATQIHERQAEGEFGVLLGGRSEIFASGRAVMDSPVIGHGSWARNPDYAVRILDARNYGYDLHVTSNLESDLIPTHSHLMGAWVEAGIVGAFFWLWVALLGIRAVSGLCLTREPLGPLIAFAGFTMLWDIAFSPFGAERRLITSFYVVLMMFAWDMLVPRIPRGGTGGSRRPSRRRRPLPLSGSPLPPRTGPPEAGAPRSQNCTLAGQNSRSGELPTRTSTSAASRLPKRNAPRRTPGTLRWHDAIKIMLARARGFATGKSPWAPPARGYQLGRARRESPDDRRRFAEETESIVAALSRRHRTALLGNCLRRC